MGNLFGSQPYDRNGCGAIIINWEGQLLVGRRAASSGTDVGTWQLPEGIFDPSKEKIQMGLQSVIHQHLGLTYKVLQWIDDTETDVTYDYPEVNPVTNARGQATRFFIWLWGTPAMEEIKFNNAAFDQVEWMTWDQLLQNVAPGKQAMYTQLRQLAEPKINVFVEDPIRFPHTSRDGPQLE